MSKLKGINTDLHPHPGSSCRVFLSWRKGRREKTRGFVELTKSRLVSKWGFTVKNVKMVRNIKFVNSVLCMRTYS